MIAGIRRAPAWVAPVGFILRRLPFARFRAVNVLCSSPPAPFTAHVSAAGADFDFRCDLRDSKQRAVCFLYSHEPQESFLFQHLTKPGMVVIDVGANWGYFSLIAAKLVGASGRVVSLEPDSRMYTALTENLAQNNFLNVTALPIAAAAEACTMTLKQYDSRSANWGVSRLILADKNAVGTDVQCYSLDSVLDGQGVTRADLTKIDVEGAEEKVLQGMRQGLAANRYSRILLELHPTLLDRPDETIDAIIAFLRQSGYVGYWIDHSNSISRKMAYGREVRLCDVLIPLEGKRNHESWPHMMWLAPGVAL